MYKTEYNFNNCVHLGNIYFIDASNSDPFLPMILSLSRVYLNDRELDRKCKKRKEGKTKPELSTEFSQMTVHEEQSAAIADGSDNNGNVPMASSSDCIPGKIVRSSMAYTLQQLSSTGGSTLVQPAPDLVLPAALLIMQLPECGKSKGIALVRSSSDEMEAAMPEEFEDSEDEKLDEEAKLRVSLGLPLNFGRCPSETGTKRVKKRKQNSEKLPDDHVDNDDESKENLDHPHQKIIDAADDHLEIVTGSSLDFAACWPASREAIIWRAWLHFEMSTRLQLGQCSPPSFLALCPTEHYEELAELVRRVELAREELTPDRVLHEMSDLNCQLDWVELERREILRNMTWFVRDKLISYWSTAYPRLASDDPEYWQQKRARTDLRNCLTCTGFHYSDANAKCRKPQFVYCDLIDWAISDSVNLDLLPVEWVDELNGPLSPVMSTINEKGDTPAPEDLPATIDSCSAVDRDTNTTAQLDQVSGVDAEEMASISDNPELQKYWLQRYRLFDRFDDGIRLDRESWFSVTCQVIAEHQAMRCACDVIVDAFCGAGGNSIRFAQTCSTVIAIDNDPAKIALARHNADVYGVASRIHFILGDFFQLAPSLRADVVFLSPPWGGPAYLDQTMFDLDSVIPLEGLWKVARAVSSGPERRVVMFLPRNTNVAQLVSVVGEAGECVEVEQNVVNTKLKTLTVYCGQAAYTGEGFWDAGRVDDTEEDEDV